MDAFLAILQNVIIGLFDNILAPVLLEIAKVIINSVIDIIINTFSWVFYFCFTTLLSIISVLSDAFEFFAGTSQGLVNGNQTVLEVMFNLDVVSKLFLSFTALGVVLSIIFSIIGVVRSMSDMTLDDKNPISKVFKNAMKSLGAFIVIPLLCIFLLRLSTIVVDTIDYTVNDGQRTSIDRVIWYNCSLNASKNENLNLDSGKMTDEQKEMLLAKNESTRAKYYAKTATSPELKSYMYNDVVDSDDFTFDFGKFDYVQGFAVSIVMILVLTGCIMVFVARLFELISLYIVGPMFAATIAQDGGEMFKQWKDLFIAKFIGSYGMVLGMRLYLIVVPLISSGRFIFTSSEITGFDGKFNAFVQLLLIVGGAFAVYKSQDMIIRLLSIEASSMASHAAGKAVGLGMSVGALMQSTGKAFGSTFANTVTGNNANDKKQDSEDNEEKDHGSFGGSGGSGNQYRGGNPAGQ